MTANRRIALNFLATYGRSLYAMILGLFTSRWLLMALGQTDYGLFGLVGGLTGFVLFFNNMLSTSVSRYYAYAVGAAQGNGAHGLEECRRWFNLALLLHTVVPLGLVLLGYPVAEYAVTHWLTIPEERVVACVWVLRFSVLSCFLGMVSVPFNAMYVAKQYIAELTIYSFVTTTLNAAFLYFMVTHPGDWLVRYAGWTSFLGIVPQLLIIVRAVWVFQECRFNRRYLWDKGKLKALLAFSAHRFAGALAIMLQGQGMAILVNKLLGPARNAAMAVGNALAGQTATLSSAFLGALSPAITQAVGAGDLGLARRLSLKTCKLGAVMALIFVLPLLSEADNVLCLWLKNPPEQATALCVFALLTSLLEELSSGLYMMLFAVGKIAAYQFWLGVLGILAVPLAGVALWIWPNLAMIGAALLLTKCFCVLVRLFFASRHGGISSREWAKTIFLPLLWISVLAWGAGMWVRWEMAPSFLRVVLTTVVTNLLFAPLAWRFALNKEERQFFVKRLAFLRIRLS